ncbi:1-acyl-sn-glycerol-3-phosphate acyltransferase [Patescibacteria group bacterium]|nr:1-acyl-sn-glycerol-3-phosphate acyltransferase [Patescibacteria group bacterium]MBU4353593.1 1-acyl-sn-glycerol-3-phosphate acyltransferase [Patescibacteria group bacterium]MBU4476898.1 1-acyl-sn-glycerol-3-phosphate acyltransferase [Patescibacteria group bacterium]MCG2699081.1 1-acyl-sn-glycerol-3-phosphate acyltransferase [Candidatus Parcubacteria bacterium]
MASIAKIFQAITYWPIYLFLKFFVHYEIEGQENLRGLENKSIIFASNHASYIDGPISAAAMPRKSFYPHEFFPIRFLVLREFFNWKNRFSFPFSILMTTYVRINGSIPVDKADGDLLKALGETIKALNNRAHVWIYPEGGMTKDGKLRQGKRGVAFLHQQTKASIVPVGIIGNFGILSTKTLLRKNKVKVKIGKPIYSLGEISLEEGAEKVMSEIAELIKQH